MKRKSLAINLTSILLVSISLFGCGNTTRNNAYRQDRIPNDVRGGSVDGTSTGANNAQSATDGNIQNNAPSGTGGNTQNIAPSGTDGNIQNNVNNASNVSDATRDRIKATTDSIRYSAENFKNDIAKAGYALKESPNTKKNYFKGNETDYLLGGDVVRLYEYNSAADLEGDMTKISPDGMTINGTNAKYTSRPYYYRKGNTLIMYEGKEPAYVDEFGRMYGSPLRS